MSTSTIARSVLISKCTAVGNMTFDGRGAIGDPANGTLSLALDGTTGMVTLIWTVVPKDQNASDLVLKIALDDLSKAVRELVGAELAVPRSE